MADQSFVVDAYKLSNEHLRALQLRPQQLAAFCDDSYPLQRVIYGDKGMGKSLMMRKKHLALKSVRTERPRLFSPPLGPKQIVETSAAAILDQIGALGFRELWKLAISLTYCAAVIHALPPDHPKRAELVELIPLELSSALPAKDFADISKTWLEITRLCAADPGIPFSRVQRFATLAIEIAEAHAIDVVMFCDSFDESWTQPQGVERQARPVATGSTVAAAAPESDPNHWVANWLSSQVGFFLCLDWLANEQSLRERLIVFGTMRPEAFELCGREYLSSTNRPISQAGDLILNLNYSFSDLEGILKDNVERRGQHDPSYLQRRVCHWRVWDGSETIAQCIIRHTLWRPRDVIHIGSLVDRMPHHSDTEQVTRVINHGAFKLIDDYVKLMIPPWTERHAQFVMQVPGSSFTRQSVGDFYDLLPGLYNHGLIGVPHVHGHYFDMQFRSRGDADDPPADALLFGAEVFFLHPMLIELAMLTRGPGLSVRRLFSTPRYIIGRGLNIDTSRLSERAGWIVYSNDGILSLRYREGERDEFIVPGRVLRDGKLTETALYLAIILLMCASRSARGDFGFDRVVREVIRLIHHGLIPRNWDFGPHRKAATPSQVRDAEEKVRQVLRSNMPEPAARDLLLREMGLPLVRLAHGLYPRRDTSDRDKWWQLRLCEHLFSEFGHTLSSYRESTNRSDRGPPHFWLTRKNGASADSGGPAVSIDINRTHSLIEPFDVVVN